MEIIYDEFGNPIKRSKNLRGIREYVSKNSLFVISIDHLKSGEGNLWILFDDGSFYQTKFADFSVLKNFVRRWKNVYGTPLLINGIDVGEVSYDNVMLFWQ